MTDAPIPYSSLWLFAVLGSVCPYLYCTVKSTTRHSTPEAVLPVLNREDRSLPGNVLPNTAQDSAGLLATRDALLAHLQLSDHQHYLVLFCSPLVSPQHALMPGAALAPAQYFALPSVALHEVAVCPFLQPAQSL